MPQGPNILVADTGRIGENQVRTADAFTTKWEMVDYGDEDFQRLLEKQKAWYLEKYGFEDEADLARHLSSCAYVLDAGTGNAMKAAWLAELSPSTTVVAADISGSLTDAAKYYQDRPNMVFIHCDIGDLSFLESGVIDFVNCDEVIHHTADPEGTFAELVRVTRPGGSLACYVYRRKALPRELLDEHFREYSKTLSDEELKQLASQLTDLGKLLSSLDEDLSFPDIPALGIEGGQMTVQRFIYWNFIKCFWDEAIGPKNSTLINFDWYSPAQAFRYSEEDFRGWISRENLEVIHFHKEQACYCGRFGKRS